MGPKKGASGAWAPSPVCGETRSDGAVSACLSRRLPSEDGVQKTSFSFLKLSGHLSFRGKGIFKGFVIWHKTQTPTGTLERVHTQTRAFLHTHTHAQWGGEVSETEPRGSPTGTRGGGRGPRGGGLGVAGGEGS